MTTDNITPLHENKAPFVQIPLDVAQDLCRILSQAATPGAAQYVAGQVYMYLRLSMNNQEMGERTLSE